MLRNAENVAMQNLSILCTFVLRAESCTVLGVNVVQISTRYRNVLANFAWLYFLHFATFPDTKLSIFYYI